MFRVKKTSKFYLGSRNLTLMTTESMEECGLQSLYSTVASLAYTTLEGLEWFVLQENFYLIFYI